MSKQTIFENLQADFAYWVALHQDEIIGVIGLRDDDHLFHLFVAEKFHRQGVAKKLWQRVLTESSALKLSVNASRYAIPVYQKMGFSWNGQSEQLDGVIYYPMYFNREHRGTDAE